MNYFHTINIYYYYYYSCASFSVYLEAARSKYRAFKCTCGVAVAHMCIQISYIHFELLQCLRSKRNGNSPLLCGVFLVWGGDCCRGRTITVISVARHWLAKHTKKIGGICILIVCKPTYRTLQLLKVNIIFIIAFHHS